MDMSDLMSVFMLWISVDYFLKWHAIFLGQDIKAAPSWYNPNRTYFKFFLFSFIFPFLLIVPMLLSFFIPLFNNGIVLPILIILIYAIFLRVNMLFPSIVKGDNLSLVNIWTLSSGMAIKIFLVPFRAHWACIPVFISYVILVLIIEEGEQMNHPMMVSIFSIVNIFIGAVYFCLFIGGLCRYYTWAMEHRFSEIKGMP